MKLQLTKDKTVEIKLPIAKAKGLQDIVGVDFSANDARGLPAVRLKRKKDGLHLAAAGFLVPPENPIPESWNDASKSCSWSVPVDYQAGAAAFAVETSETFLVQTTPEELQRDINSGMHKSSDAAPATEKRNRFAIRRPMATGKAEAKPEAAEPETKPVAVTMPPAVPGVPVSNGGTRFVMQPMDENQFVMEAGMPEFQVLWLSRLLPEGRRPTAASIQPRRSSVLASVYSQPDFRAANGTALVLFALPDAMTLAGFREGELVLWRKCPGARGLTAIKNELIRNLGLEESMLAPALDDAIVDPMPVLGPILEPIISDFAITRDYFANKHKIENPLIMVIGVGFGARYWQKMAVERLGAEFVMPSVFDGLKKPAKEGTVDKLSTEGAAATVYLGALGAALALMLEGDAE